eukprot:1143403-Pelagomonas_calceolata.AAC.2
MSGQECPCAVVCGMNTVLHGDYVYNEIRKCGIHGPVVLYPLDCRGGQAGLSDSTRCTRPQMTSAGSIASRFPFVNQILASDTGGWWGTAQNAPCKKRL